MNARWWVCNVICSTDEYGYYQNRNTLDITVQNEQYDISKIRICVIMSCIFGDPLCALQRLM